MIGEQAHDAELIDPAGKPYRLSKAWAAGPAALVFYPGDFTRVCTAQLCDYRNRWADFARAGANVVGINPANYDRHAAFTAANGFPYPLLSDPGGACCAAYLAKAWYGTRRMIVVVDRQGIERWRKTVLPFSRQSADEVLAALRDAAVPAR